MNNNLIIANLRTQIDNLTRERNLSNRELRENARENNNLVQQRNALRRRLRLLQNQKDDLQNENDDLTHEVRNLTGRLQNYKPKIYHKGWQNIACQTRRKRKADYNQMFDDVLQRIPECKKAKLQLRLGNQDVSFKWNLQDMQNHRNALKRNGHTIRDPTILPEDESDSDHDTLPVEKKRRRSVVSLMDEFKLSQKGYHEFRYLISKAAPPLHHIKNERVIMSGQIPYIKHPTVSQASIILNFPR